MLENLIGVSEESFWARLNPPAINLYLFPSDIIVLIVPKKQIMKFAVSFIKKIITPIIT